MLNDFSEQDIASLTEWLTKYRLQKLRDAFEINYKIPFCNFNMEKGQMVLIVFWFWNDLAYSYTVKKRPRGGTFEQLFGPGGGEFDH